MEFLHANMTLRMNRDDGQPMIVNVMLDPQAPPMFNSFQPDQATQPVGAGSSAPLGVSQDVADPTPTPAPRFDGHRVKSLVTLVETNAPAILALLALFGLKLPLPLPIPTPPAA